MTTVSSTTKARWWRFLLAALAAAVVTLLGVTSASAVTLPELGTRVGASTPTVVHVVGPHESITAGQRWGNAPPAADSVVATGVAAKAAPSAQEIVETTARSQAARGADALSGALSPAERAAMARQPWLQKPMLGQAVHRSTADALEEAYPGRFVYRTRGPDFLDTSTGELLELTTPGQVGAHLARPGYGGVTMCTYSLGAC